MEVERRERTLRRPADLPVDRRLPRRFGAPLRHDESVLHLRLRVPPDLADKVTTLLGDDPTVTDVLVIPDAYVKPPGHLVMADVARESAQTTLAELRSLGLSRNGAIAVTEAETIMSDSAARAERAAPGTPIDGVVWDLIEDRTRDDVRLSWAFVSFLTLATLIASVGRLLDQPILIVGAMVVGPEFAAVAAICFALARPRPSLLPPALTTLFGGFAVATLIATTLGAAVHAFGGFTAYRAAHGRLTDFIVQPDAWSFVIALLAGVAGTLSLTTSKSATLVGVFISVTTVPAIGTLSLSLATANWSESLSSLLQLALNLVGLVLAGTGTLLVQKHFWVRVRRNQPAQAGEVTPT